MSKTGDDSIFVAVGLHIAQRAAGVGRREGGSRGELPIFNMSITVLRVLLDLQSQNVELSFDPPPASYIKGEMGVGIRAPVAKYSKVWCQSVILYIYCRAIKVSMKQ